MKESEVPQDHSRAFEGQKKAIYATDTNGRYAISASSGWEAEEIVLDQAIAHFEQQASDALERVRNGQAASLEYHMYDQRMDLTLLAQSAGVFKWRVRRHLRPAVFARLNNKMLQRYADALGLKIQQLSLTPDAN